MHHEVQRRRALPIEIVGTEIVQALGGEWRDGGGMCRCPAHDDRNPSLSVRVGRSALLFKCFAGCRTEEVMAGLRRLGLSQGGAWITAGLPLLPAGSAPAMRKLVLEIWNASLPLVDSPAADYLAGRCLDHRSEALRYNPRTPLGRGRAVVFRPAMIAAIRDPRGLVAIQRIFLDARHPSLARDLANPRRALGRPRTGAVMLGRASTTLGIAEGVETALAAMILFGTPVWATLGSERLARVAIPDTVTNLWLLPDRDKAGRKGALEAREAHQRDGRQIRIIWPPAGMNDWNDVLRAGGKGVGEFERMAT
jgi:hypothetical protein